MSGARSIDEFADSPANWRAADHTPPETRAVKTLPTLSIEWGVHLDALRKFLARRRPDLRALGEQIGGAWAFDAEAAAEIRAAFLEHLAAKSGAATATT